jgi:type I restriction enzyme M protein
MDLLGRYYTADFVSDLLVQNFITKEPKKIIDLGIGNASLTKAAYNKWGSAKFYATEIERSKTKRIERGLAFINIFNYDTLQPNLSQRLRIQYGSMDIAICNPPYIRIEDKNKYSKLFNSIGCEKFNELKNITSEIVFFSHNLKLLKRTGELGIIVSDTLITGKEYKIFRETILKQFTVRRIIQLPDKIFNNTEARTHIIFISKIKSTNRTCDLFMSSNEGKLFEKITVPIANLAARMDHQFYNAKIHINPKCKTLKEIGASIKRGKYSFKELKESNLSFFHSTHFNKNTVEFNFERPVSDKHSDYTANVGDILMCRVGKRVVGKVAIVKSGKVINSDCIYRISVPKIFQSIVLKSFLSEQGKAWLRAYAHGVCSQVISKSDLENFPLFCL